MIELTIPLSLYIGHPICLKIMKTRIVMRKNILITGASSGLGWGMAKEFAAQGANLALCARRTDKLEELKSELETNHPNIKVSILPLELVHTWLVNFTVCLKFETVK